MATINQLTANPTNKLAASTVTNSIIGSMSLVSALIVKNIWPTWYDAETWAAVTLMVTVILPYIHGWYTRDEPQVVVVVEEGPKI